MPRQLLAQGAPSGPMTRVATIAEGGTGASTPDEAVSNLGGLSRHLLGQPEGLLQADSRGFFPLEILKASGVTIGYSLQGPKRLVHGQKTVYEITNFNSLSNNSVSISHGSIALVGQTLEITAPVDQDSVEIQIGDRKITLPVIPFEPLAPELTTPYLGETLRRLTTLKTAPFEASLEFYGDWVPVTENTLVLFPEKSIALEIQGAKGLSGFSFATLGSTSYPLGYSVTKRRIKRGAFQEASFAVSGTGTLRYRFVYPNARHVATDWEVSVDPLFETLIASSMGDTVHLTEWQVELPEGDYFVRTRFHGDVVTPE